MKHYQITKTTELKELNATLTELVHSKSGAKIIHIKNDDPENLFCLSFKTIPDSSNGVAHILEHTVLCGSEKYPIKDPFFGMTRRSLNTFMNAMTGSDFTCYPASTQVEKDFYNLLEVYLDAVFFPKLHPYSLLQEGVRLEFKEPTNPTSPLEFKGIVFNEMKGALASGIARLSEKMNAALYPDITYGINSGGDPKEIPNLTYEGLKSFHQKFYHPSQCLFFFYGDLPLEKHLDFIHEKVLKSTEHTAPIAEVKRQPRFKEPRKIEMTYPVPADSSLEDKAYVSFGWVTSYIKDTLETLAMTTLVLVLMDNDASILKQAILKSGLCKQATAYIDTEMTEAPFILTLRGLDASSADALEAVVFDSMRSIVKNGIVKDRIDSVIHQLELSRSEITGDSHPYGLSLYMRSALLCHHGVEPEEGLLVHKVFDILRDKIEKEPRYLESLLEKHLLNNPHHVRIVMTPSTTMAEEELQEEKDHLQKISDAMTVADKLKIVEQSEALLKFQTEMEEQDIDILPKVTLEDVPHEGKYYALDKKQVGNISLFSHETFTNYIAYADLVFDLPQFPESDLPYIRLLSAVLPQMGAGGKNYIDTLHSVQENTGGIGAALAFNLQVDDATTFSPSFQIRGKSLYRKKEKFFEIIRDMATQIDWEDQVRFKEIMDKHVSALTGTIQQQALRYAMSLSASGLSGCNKLANSWFGIDYIESAKVMSKDLPETLLKLKEVYEKIVSFAPPSLVITADKAFIEEGIETGFWGLTALKTGSGSPKPWEIAVSPIESQGQLIASQVAFIAKTMRTIPCTHPDSPTLQVVAHMFDNLTLHAKIREQGGAYGGGTSCSASGATLCFYSYRDPHISATFDAFKAAIDGLITGDFEDEDLTEAKLEIIQAFDSPVSPGARGEVAYGWLRDGKTAEMIQDFREKVLAITRKDVIEATKKYIAPNLDTAPAVVFAGKALLEKENKILKHPLPLHTVPS